MLTRLELREPATGEVLLVSDTDGDSLWSRVIAHAVRLTGIDTVVHLGDSRGGSARLARERWADLGRRVGDAGGTIYWLAGNHCHPLSDLVPDGKDHELRKAPWKSTYLLPRTSTWTWHGRRWLAVQGAVSLDWPTREARGFSAEAEITSEEEATQIIESGVQADVLISHDAPWQPATAGTISARTNNRMGFSRTLLEASRVHSERLSRIYRAVGEPKVVAHGHMHLGGIERRDGTTVVSVGAKFGGVSIVRVDLSSLAMEAVPWSPE